MNYLQDSTTSSINAGFNYFGQALQGIFPSWCGRSVEVRNDLEVLSESEIALSKLKGNVTPSFLPIVPQLETLKCDPDYGNVDIQPFNPTWLADYPNIIEHLHTEHLLAHGKI